MPKTDLETLTVTFEASITKFERSMQKMLATTQNTTGRTRKATDDAMKAMEDRTAKAAAQMDRSLKSLGSSGTKVGRDLQNASFQVGDFFVQIASGQDAMRAAAQQLPQLLGGFGVFGAVAGAAVAALSAVVGQMDLFGASSSANAEDLKTFNDAMKDSKVSADIADEGYDALIAKLGKLTTATREALIATLQQNIETNEAGLKAGSVTLTGKIDEQWRKIIETIGGFGEEAKNARAEIFNLNQEIRKDPNNSENYLKMAAVLRDLAGKATGDTATAFRKLADEMSIAAGNSQTLTERNERLKTVQALARGEVVEGGKAVVNAGTDAETAAGKIDKLAGSVENVGLAFGRLREIGTGGFGDLREALAKEREHGVTIPDRPDAGGTLGQVFQGVDVGQLKLDELTDRFLNPNGSKPPKEKKASTKKTPADRAENKTQQLKEEITYNQQLAAAYTLGEEAMRKVTAAYEALKSARQAGLKEGSAEYQKYIDEATANNLVNLELEHRLDLMKEGKALAETVMTDDEKRNKLLADYQEMLKAGAIDTTVYERAVAKAKDQNDALKDAIGGVGDAIQSGIQGATSFTDALMKIGLQLLSLAARGLFGEGPFGGIFNKLLGVAAGGIFGTATGGAVGTPSAGLGTGFRRSFAAGGMAGPGPFLVGENGPEILNTAQRGHVMPAQATRRLLTGAASSGPIAIYVSGARGNQEIAQMVAAGVAEGVKQSGRNVPGIQRGYNLRFGP